MTPLEISLKILPAIIALLSFILVICLGKTYHPMTALHKTYIRIDGILHEKKFSLIMKKREDFDVSWCDRSLGQMDRPCEILSNTYLSGCNRIYYWSIY